MFIIKRYKSIKNWNVSNGNDFSSMFSKCSSLIDIKGLANWNVSNGKFLNYMFNECSSLTDMNGLESWNIKWI